MIRSYPPPLIHASDLFKFRLDVERRSPPLSESHDEIHSVHSGRDDESVASAGEFYHESRSTPVEEEDRPLNLSCKRRKVDDEAMTSPQNSRSPEANDDEIEMKPYETRSQAAAADAGKLNLFPSDAVERAIMQYRAQIFASNEFVRALMRQRWNDEVSSAIGRLPAASSMSHSASQWIPVTGQLGPYDQSSTPAVHGSIQELRNSLGRKENDVTRTDGIGRYISSPSSISTSPISSPSLSPPIELNSKSPVCSPGFVVIGGQTMPTSPPTRATQPLIFEPPSAFYPKFDEKNNPVSSLSPTSENSLSPSRVPTLSCPDPQLNRKRRRSKRSGNPATNSNGESYPCSICGASYPHKFELNRHVKVSHVRPHRCTQCGKGFGHRNYLKVHIETVHMGRKSHQCRLCGKYLSTGGNLNVHVRTIHLGEKKYNCPVCSRSFGQQCNMKTHMKRHYTKSDEL